MINELSPFYRGFVQPGLVSPLSFQHLGGQENSAGTKHRSFNIAAKSGVNPRFLPLLIQIAVRKLRASATSRGSKPNHLSRTSKLFFQLATESASVPRATFRRHVRRP